MDGLNKIGRIREEGYAFTSRCEQGQRDRACGVFVCISDRDWRGGNLMICHQRMRLHRASRRETRLMNTGSSIPRRTMGFHYEYEEGSRHQTYLLSLDRTPRRKLQYKDDRPTSQVKIMKCLELGRRDERREGAKKDEDKQNHMGGETS